MKTRNVFSLAVVAMVLVAACGKYKSGNSLPTEIKSSESKTEILGGACAPATGALPVTITAANQDAVINDYAALHNDYLDYYFASLTVRR